MTAVVLVVLGMVQSQQQEMNVSQEPDVGAVTSSKGKIKTIRNPADKLDLTNWKITLPIDKDGNKAADEIKQPALNSFSLIPYFNLSGDGVAFRAYADGATTDNSGYPRSELREMTNNGQKKASWSNSTGSHAMTVTGAITHLPDVKRQVVAAQIHDASDDVIMIRLENTRLFVEAGGENIGDLDTNYALGKKFTVKITAQNKKINVYYNDIQKVTYAKNGEGYYFKAGCYTQTNLTKGDRASSYGEVVIYDLHVLHA